eukprot:TRINITY_DN11356_c0_g1_i2.p1 TRINITY_DN11356_c0_g1~~TRINITY_DN11356_c0_g1_i2.p1  ORF type:complete len:394 (+),score=84.21 TRINITY_DN11356_c0_g1_i2:69-1184(+)
MALLAGLAAAAAAGPPPGSSDLLSLRLLNSSTRAACLDGSPAGYYARPGSDSSRWILWLQGGGECLNETACTTRRSGVHGSSAGWNATMAPPNGALHSGPDAHPAFANWTKIFVPYCSGDDWTGMEDAPRNPWNATGATTFTFAGHLILEAVVSDLIERDALSSATELLFSGCSAGGQGVFYHADWLPARLPGVRVHVNPQAAWFGLQYPTWAMWRDGVLGPSGYPTVPVWLAGIRAFWHEGCAAGMQAAGRSLLGCGDMPTLFPFISSPVFISENVYDRWQVVTEGGIPTQNMTDEQIAYLEMFGNVMRRSLQQVVIGSNRSDVGLFAPACIAHELQWSGPAAPAVGGLTHAAALARGLHAAHRGVDRDR